ncbi:hypothetical protein niasHS_000229 [Heterodera schachtii]|uniref:DNA-directed DNA polymerase n=1 Tax=Heterodera schachtii TaxID=97005 RepID=A0ABD2KBT6_HETSC
MAICLDNKNEEEDAKKKMQKEEGEVDEESEDRDDEIQLVARLARTVVIITTTKPNSMMIINSMAKVTQEQQQQEQEAERTNNKRQRICLSSVEEPEEVMRSAFQMLMARAIQHSEQQSGRKVVKIGVTLQGRGLLIGLHDPIVLPLRPPEQNSSDTLMAELDKLGQKWMSAGQQQQQHTMARLTLMQDFCETNETFRRLIVNRELMCSAVRRLMLELGIPEAQAAYGMDHLQAVQEYWVLLSIVMPFIASCFSRITPRSCPSQFGRGHQVVVSMLYCFLANGHYDGIGKISCFFKLGKHYCVDCECSYGRALKHTLECVRRCPQCAKIGPEHPCVKEPGVKILCPACNRFFFSQRCYEGHQGQTCSLLKRCNCCWRVYQLDPKRPHKCFHQVLYTLQEPMVAGGQQQIHKVNFLSVRVTCSDCADSAQGAIEQCEICMNEDGLVERSKYWSEADGDDPVANFVEWIMRAWSEEFSTYIWAHNASRFDGHFVLRYLGETRRRPDVVMNGLKIFEFRLQHSRGNSFLIWRDSCLLLPIRLDGLKGTFDLDCPDKPFFPYGFNRSYWHGCERCFEPGDKLVDGKTCRELNETTQDRLTKLREPDPCGTCIEECEINGLLSDPRNFAMRHFFEDLGNERGPIDPRSAYCGGRTGPLNLFSEPVDDEKISVYDIVNYDTEYPIGIPKIIHPSVEEIMVNWNSPNDLVYRGLYRVRVIPPRGLRIPVLPMKLDERLLFSCCHRCASKFRHLGTRLPHNCEHTDQQRAYCGTYTHIELARALECGYRVDRFWRAWHYEQWSDQIFKEYVRLMIEASGFPDRVQNEQQKQTFAEEYMRQYNVQMDLSRVNKNAGLRFIAKLMLNSLWGKFSMRNELGENRVITKPQEFYKLALDHKVDTDSVIVKHRRGVVPLQTGEFLGQMSEEYTGYSIKSFVCGGAKQYALKMVDERTGEIRYVQKIRGITFDVQNSQALQFEHFRHKVLNYGRQGEMPAVFSYDKIQPTRASQIVTRQEMSSNNKDNSQCKSDKETVLKPGEKGHGVEKGEEIVFLGMTINETPKEEKKELPPSTSSADNRKRRHSFDGSATSMLGLMIKAQGESRAEWLDVLEKKYSKLEEEMGVDDNASDVVDFGEDSLDTILKKVERSEKKVRDWEAAHCSNATDFLQEGAQSSSTESETEVTDDDSIDDDDEEEEAAN